MSRMPQSALQSIQAPYRPQGASWSFQGYCLKSSSSWPGLEHQLYPRCLGNKTSSEGPREIWRRVQHKDPAEPQAEAVPQARGGALRTAMCVDGGVQHRGRWGQLMGAGYKRIAMQPSPTLRVGVNHRGSPLSSTGSQEWGWTSRAHKPQPTVGVSLASSSPVSECGSVYRISNCCPIPGPTCFTIYSQMGPRTNSDTDFLKTFHLH